MKAPYHSMLKARQEAKIKIELHKLTDSPDGADCTGLQGVPWLSGWVDFDLDLPLILPSCFAHSAYSHQPKQNQAARRQDKIKVNPTHIRNLLGDPVDTYIHNLATYHTH